MLQRFICLALIASSVSVCITTPAHAVSHSGDMLSYRGSGRIDGDKPQGAAKASRDEFPGRRVGTPKDEPTIPPARRGGWVEDHQGLVAQSDRDQFPADRRGSGGPAPRAPKA